MRRTGRGASPALSSGVPAREMTAPTRTRYSLSLSSRCPSTNVPLVERSMTYAAGAPAAPAMHSVYLPCSSPGSGTPCSQIQK
jgi:hypothetical protein